MTREVVLQCKYKNASIFNGEKKITDVTIILTIYCCC